MTKITNSLNNIWLLDDLAKKGTSIHKMHPLVKLVTTLVYLAAVISFGRYDIGRLLPYVFYPVVIIALAELPVVPVLKRVLLVEPFIIGIGILNPLFDNHTVMLGGVAISHGWVTFLSIFIKCGLTVVVSILLVATTGMDKLAAALRMLKLPKLFVLQLLLTYRYISVLIEEVFRMQRAYSLRAPGQKGIHISIWGSFAGQLILRTYERAQRVYQSMSLRGFTGEYNTGKIARIGLKDFAYIAGWSLFFITARIYDVPMLIGILFTGVINK
ncbi:MAG TPA: cobalt ECF transporter T component CbiQ [Clostridia bacterium]|nr:cobalt ECF transporter T component CbiQ [Clostridia bacterium]